MTTPNDPTAAILIIGTEVLTAKVADQNGPYLLRELRQLGIRVLEQRVVHDDMFQIVDAIRAMRRATYLFTTGGIGPTHDDITMDAVAHAFDVSVVPHPGILQHLREKYGDAIPSGVMRFANVPATARVDIGPETSFVPLIQIQNTFVLPGVPVFVRQCFEVLKERLTRGPWSSSELYLNIGESKIADLLTEVQRSYPDVAIGSYPNFDNMDYRVKITFDSRDPELVQRAFKAVVAQLNPHVVTRKN